MFRAIKQEVKMAEVAYKTQLDKHKEFKFQFLRMDTKEMLKNVLDAYKTKDVTNVLREIGMGNIIWYPVGGKKNNSGIINMGTDPASALTERITNAIDAVLEKEWKGLRSFGFLNL